MSEKKWIDRVFGHIKPSQWMVLAAAVVSLFLNVAVFYISGFVSSLSYLAFILSTTAVLLFDKIERYRFENNTMDELSRFSRSELNLHHLGDSSEAVEWFCNNSSGLRAVSNTVFFRMANEELLYTNEQMPRYESHIKHILDVENCHWRDLSTKNQVHVMDNFRSTLTPKQLGRHTYQVLDTDTTLLQVLIMRYRDKAHPPAVLFGWAFPGGRTATVFLSQGRETVDYFQDYFDKLYAASTPPTHTSVPALPMQSELSPPPPQETRRRVWRPWLKP